jgi:hypothetical protein
MMDVTFTCPFCEYPGRASLAGLSDWQCPGCDHRLHVDTREDSASLSTCVICGNRELYKQKNFPHWLGMAILGGACLASVFTYGWYEKWLTWAILLGSALVDGLLYMCVGDAIVCYRCNASYRGIKAGEDHQPFELGTGERYRQERLRREQLQAGKKNV